MNFVDLTASFVIRSRLVNVAILLILTNFNLRFPSVRNTRYNDFIPFIWEELFWRTHCHTVIKRTLVQNSCDKFRGSILNFKINLLINEVFEVMITSVL